MKKAWKIFDKNGDGKLTPQEFRYKMNAASKIDFNDYDSGLVMMITMKTCRWMTRQSMLSERQIDLVFQRFDSDGDGNLNFKEFKT